MQNFKLLVLLLAICGLTTLTAQTSQGNLIVGGNAGFSSETQKDVDGATNTLTISPLVGYFIIDNLAAGASISFRNIKNTELDDGITFFDFGPFVRYYTQLGLFGELAYQISSETVFDNDAVNGSWIIPRVGYAAFLNNHVALEPSIFYAIGGGDLYEDLSTFGLNIGFTIYLN